MHPKKSSTLHKKSLGFTLIEILIVISILAFLIIMVFFTMQKQVSKGRDGRRKSDINKIKTAFEDYYNDNDCYPPAGTLAACGQPLGESGKYLKEIPCDPSTHEPYQYLSASGGYCSGYRVLAKLENLTDAGITEVGCIATACGSNGDYYEYNYGTAQGTTVPEEGWDGETVSEGGGGGGTSPTGEPSCPMCSTFSPTDDWYCVKNYGCTQLIWQNADMYDCFKVFECPTCTNDNPPAECVSACTPSSPDYSSVACPNAP